MDNFSTLKIIKASAGTGKTYRLSLEFIRLILKYGDYINFDEILIITFTRKATAEIRERIFEHLEVLTNNTEGYTGLVENLKELDAELTFSKENLSQLKNVYHQMITDKGNLRISTIDSFVFSIFTSIIAPHYNIESPVIDDTINKDYLPELFEALFAAQNLDRFNRIFVRAYARNLKSYEKFILDLIGNRWQIELGVKEQKKSKEDEQAAVKHLEQYVNKMGEAFQIFAQYLEADDKSFEPTEIFNQRFRELMFFGNNAASLSQTNFEQFFVQILQDRQFIDQNFTDLLSMGSFFNGSKLMRKKEFSGFKAQIYELQEKAEDDLSNYILTTLFKQEQNEILAIADVIYKAYDRIKFRDCIFTYDDISYYTYRFLYDPDISIFESTSVLNVFYEFLSFRIRFMLIDEFQDTSVIQWSILQPIISDIISGEGIKPYGGTIIVGDEKQSIYGWRGGERDLLLKAGYLMNRVEKPDSLKRCFRYSEFLSSRINRLFRSDHLHGFLAQAGIIWDYTKVEAADRSDQGYFDYSLKNLFSANWDKRKYFEQVIVHDLLPLLKNGKINPADTAILTRRNKDLALIAEILLSYNIPFLMESSNSVFRHQAISPILHLLRYLVIDDIYDLLKFLRSDVVLFSAEEMKHVIEKYQATDSRELFLASLSEDQVISSISEIENDLDTINLTALIRMIIEQFNIQKKYSSELDLRNISFFLEISASYFLNKIDVSASIEGFLDFVENNIDNSEYNQIGLDQSEVIRLMSVHKSKGLQFETLFFLYEANPKPVKDSNDLKLLFNYNENYRSIFPLYMTFNYGAVLKKGICAEFHQREVNKKIIEELNSLYVALTRVKSNLIIRGFFNLKKGIKDLLGNIQSDKTRPLLTESLLPVSQRLLPMRSLRMRTDFHLLQVQL